MERAEYRRRNPEESVLYQVVRRDLETFLARADERAEEGKGLPKYVREEFRRYLGCGVLARGFARVRCPECTLDLLVPFS